MKALIVISFFVLFAYSITLESKLTWVILLAALVLLTYLIAIFRIDLERANFYFLGFIIFTIPAPFLIKAMGGNAVTATTALILLLLAPVGFMLAMENWTYSGPAVLLALPLLITFNILLSFALHPFPLGSSIRFLVANLSGPLLYFLILAVAREESRVISLTEFILAGLLVQTGVTFIQTKFTALGVRLTTIFQGGISSESYARGQIVRPGGLSGGYELMAEMFLAGALLSMGLIYQKRNFLGGIGLFGCLAGIMFTKTRSALLLLLASVVFVAALLKVLKMDRDRLSLKIALAMVLGGALFYGLFPGQVASFVGRLESYFGSDQLLSARALNREEVWGTARDFLSRPSIFGNGLFTVSSLYTRVTNFHSLYFSLLYKLGIVGLALHVAFWLYLLKNAFLLLLKRKRVESWYAGFFLFSALLFILLDEIKIEYLRDSHSIQFVWMIYGLVAVFIITAGQRRGDVQAGRQAADKVRAGIESGSWREF